MMLKLALVFLGSGLGAMARYKLGGFVLHHATDWRFPLATFVVNVLGCALAGVFGGLVVRQGMLSPDLQLFLFTGLLGGFTTFSAFGVETVYLLQRGHAAVAVAYAVGSVVCGAAGLWMGMQAIPHSHR